MEDRALIFREATIPMSSFSRSAFGVGISLLLSPDDPKRCLCGLLPADEEVPQECNAFRRNLFNENATVLVKCPAGLSLALLPVIAGGGLKVLLQSDSFLREGESLTPPKFFSDNGFPAALFEAADIRTPRLSVREIDLLVQFLENTGAVYPLLRSGSQEASFEKVRESFWSQVETAYTLVGATEDIVRLRETLPTLANTVEPVLIESEIGNGRHLVASMLHRLGPRREGPFICENIPALPEPLQERELFGARNNGDGGLASQAEGGTLFLVGIDALSPSGQRGLLQFLGSKNAGLPADRGTKIIAATSRSLTERVRKGRFRSDLQRKLARFSLFLPPLRDRKEDIPLLAGHFLQRIADRTGESLQGLDGEALTALQQYSWPGNVRELESETEKASLPGKETIELGDLSIPLQQAARPPQATSTNIREAVGSLEKRLISQTLGETNWNKSQAARILGLSRLGLQKKIDRYGLDRRR